MTEVGFMVSSLSAVVVGASVAFAIVLSAVPANAATELATAQGLITISEPRPGLRAPSCSELIVEARDALDNHLIAKTQPTVDEVGMCRYALSVPAQMAVWLRVQPVLISGVHVMNANIMTHGSGTRAPMSGSVALRFTIISPTTYFFAPREEKAISLSY